MSSERAGVRQEVCGDNALTSCWTLAPAAPGHQRTGPAGTEQGPGNTFRCGTKTGGKVSFPPPEGSWGPPRVLSTGRAHRNAGRPLPHLTPPGSSATGQLPPGTTRSLPDPNTTAAARPDCAVRLAWSAPMVTRPEPRSPQTPRPSEPPERRQRATVRGVRPSSSRCNAGCSGPNSVPRDSGPGVLTPGPQNMTVFGHRSCSHAVTGWVLVQ